jgi:signal peptidase I
VALEAQDRNYYDLVRSMGHAAVNSQFTVTSRPVDKRENYIKRCIGIAGDVITINKGLVSVNGKPEKLKPTGQITYAVKFKSPDVNFGIFTDLGFDVQSDISSLSEPNTYEFTGTEPMMAEVRKLDFVLSVAEDTAAPDYKDVGVFPHDPNKVWNVDNYGPITVPKKGWTVKLDSVNMPVYERAIRIYEGNKVEKSGDGWLINGQKTNSYTFKMDYFWMMGDNRHNSLDSRYFGFVPEDHIVGKALFIWMSFNDHGSFLSKIRWNRIFRGIH